MTGSMNERIVLSNSPAPIGKPRTTKDKKPLILLSESLILQREATKRTNGKNYLEQAF